jgi:hypothetical protein
MKKLSEEIQDIINEAASALSGHDSPYDWRTLLPLLIFVALASAVAWGRRSKNYYIANAANTVIYSTLVFGGGVIIYGLWSMLTT